MPFEPWHIHWLNVQDEQRWFAPVEGYGEMLQRSGRGFTAFAGMDVVGCAGIMPLWNGRAQVWAMFSNLIQVYPVVIHKAVKRYIDAYQVTRLECTVDPRSERAVRWARRLGFEYEGTMRKYTPIETDMDMYVRIR